MTCSPGPQLQAQCHWHRLKLKYLAIWTARALERTGAQNEQAWQKQHICMYCNIAHWVKRLFFLPFSWDWICGKKSTRNECCLRHVSGRRESSCCQWKQPQNSGHVTWESRVKYYLNVYFLLPLFPTSIFYLSPMCNCSNVLIQIHLILLVLKNCTLGEPLALVYDISVHADGLFSLTLNVKDWCTMSSRPWQKKYSIKGMKTSCEIFKERELTINKVKVGQAI